MYWVYILYSENSDKYHIGQTGNIEARLNKHIYGKVTSTKEYAPLELKHIEQFSTIGKAMKLEKFLKNQRNREFRRRLIACSNCRVLGSTKLHLANNELMIHSQAIFIVFIA